MSVNGGVYIAANTTAEIITATAALFPITWTALGNRHGDASITETGATGKLTCPPGRYFVSFTASVDVDDSTTSISFQLYKDASAVTGMKCTNYSVASGRPASVSFQGFVDVASSDTGALQVYVVHNGLGTATITITEAQFVALAVDG